MKYSSLLLLNLRHRIEAANVASVSIEDSTSPQNVERVIPIDRKGASSNHLAASLHF